MESTAFPLNLTLKVEEGEEEIQSPELEDGPTDTQKVRICSESAWVSQGVGGHAAEQQGPGAGLCVKLPHLGLTRDVKVAQPHAGVCVPEKTVLWL